MAGLARGFRAGRGRCETTCWTSIHTGRLTCTTALCIRAMPTSHNSRSSGAGPLLETAAQLGISVTPSNSAPALRGTLAQAGYGQGAVMATPLRMARVAAAIANGGVLRDVRLEANAVASDTEGSLSSGERSRASRALHARRRRQRHGPTPQGAPLANRWEDRYGGSRWTSVSRMVRWFCPLRIREATYCVRGDHRKRRIRRPCRGAGCWRNRERRRRDGTHSVTDLK